MQYGSGILYAGGRSPDYASRWFSTQPLPKFEVWRYRSPPLPYFTLPYERTFFRYEEWLVGNNILYLKFWDKLTPFEQKRRFSIDIRS